MQPLLLQSSGPEECSCCSLHSGVPFTCAKKNKARPSHRRRFPGAAACAFANPPLLSRVATVAARGKRGRCPRGERQWQSNGPSRGAQPCGFDPRCTPGTTAGHGQVPRGSTAHGAAPSCPHKIYNRRRRRGQAPCGTSADRPRTYPSGMARRLTVEPAAAPPQAPPLGPPP